MSPRPSRRGALRLGAAVGGLALAGCSSWLPAVDRPGGSGERPASDDPPPVAGWPTFGRDRANTGFDPDAAGPHGDAGVAWRFDGGTPTMNASPVLADGTVYTGATGGDGGLFAVDAETGEREWRVETPKWVTSAPAVADGVVYAGTTGETFFPDEGVLGAKFLAVDAADGTVLWERVFRTGFTYSSPVVADGTVYVGTTGPPAVLALDAATGEERWRFADFGPETDLVESSPALADGLLVFGDDAGTLYALAAATGDVEWVRRIRIHSRASPAIGDGTVYYAGLSGSDHPESTLWALDIRTGETRWTADVPDSGVETSPAVADGAVYVAATSRRTCFGPAGSDDGGDGGDDNGTDEGDDNGTDEGDDGGTDDGDGDCSGVTRGRLYAVDAATGEERWRTEIRPGTESSPAVADGTVYLGNAGGVVAVGTDGEREWRVDFASPSREHDPYVRSSPAVGGGRVYVGSSTGRLYAIGEGTR